MKERRKAGATHSFRLTREAADIVDNMTHPRRLGGKSRKVSDAIVAFFGHSYGGHQMPSYGELVDDVAALEKLIAKKHENEAPNPPWWRRLWPF